MGVPLAPAGREQHSVQIVEALTDATVFDTTRRPVYTLQAGGGYLLHDEETGFALRDKAVRRRESIGRRLPRYRGEDLDGGCRILLPFIGRLGDAIVVASCVHALARKYPGIAIDIACTPDAWDVMDLVHFVGELIPYPVRAEQLGEYDYHMNFEDVETIPDGAIRSLADVFSQILHTPRPQELPRIMLPRQMTRRLKRLSRPCGIRRGTRERNLVSELPGRGELAVAIHRGRDGNLRSYPREQTARLAEILGRQGIDVYLIGTGSPQRPGFTTADSGVFDMTGRTASPADLVALLQRMNVLITCDSFPLHLAGAMRLPTVALFACTDSVIASDYPNVRALASDAPCSPCRVADGVCLLGRAGCLAHDTGPLAPERIAETVGSLMDLPPSSG